MRLHHLAIVVDLGWVALSAILAVLIRDNFVPWEQHLDAAIAYTTIAVAVSGVVFPIAGLYRRLWQFTSLPDILRIIASVTVALLLAIFLSFAGSRLEGVARSVPVIQWFLLVGAMVGTRIAIRSWQDRRRHDLSPHTHVHVEHILIVGVSHLTELFLQSVTEFAANRVDIVGILSEERELRGRLIGFCKVLGTPEELPLILAQLEIHGVTVERIVVTQPFERLSSAAREGLLELEKSSSVKVDWVGELLGLTPGGTKAEVPPLASRLPLSQTNSQGFSLSYRRIKRAFDTLGAIALSIALIPVIVVVATLVAIDFGFPIIFWQKRPGEFGRPFKLFKFNTMRPAHDGSGARIADEERSSIVGRILRRSRLDEIPQLYNVLIGEMSFVGPRPLLPSDQPMESSARLLVRPGLTGLAQLYGARDMSAEDKNALDIWYIQHASLWLDIKLLVRTPFVLLRGEQVNQLALRVARKEFDRFVAKNTADPQSATEHSAAHQQVARARI